jgi:fibronectin type 3 domain-containing protein
MRARLLLAALFVVAGCSTRTTDPVFDNPLDPGSGTRLSRPTAVTVAVGNNRVKLSWTPPEGTVPDDYAVFRTRTDGDPPHDTKLVARPADTTYTDTDVRNGRTYTYELASGKDGKFGERTETVDAAPALFTVVIAGDAPRVNGQAVQLTVGGPAATEAVQVGEDPAFSGASWRRMASTLTWTLSPGDGEKTVYARFRLADGTESLPVTDQVTLDTRAVIGSVSFDGDPVRTPGESIHFRLDAGETDGAATVDVAGLFGGLPLFDDGTSGDPTAGDGVYERDATIPGGTTTLGAVVRGRFTDAAGNVAAQVDAARTLSVREAPEAVTLLDLTASLPPDPAQVVVRWTQSLDNDFASYLVYRDTTDTVDPSDPLAGTITNRSTVNVTDGGLEEGMTYYYRVYVRTSLGLETGSNTLAVAVPNVRPPSAVRLNDPDGTGYTRLALSWTRNPELDFAAYRVYRNEDGAVDDNDLLVGEITDREHTYLDDDGLIENTVYHYRVYTVDTAGLTARSNEVEGRTANQKPPAVVLDAASAVVDTAATLTWSQSDVHDFASYRLYRSESPSVSSSSVLVSEISDRDGTSFRDKDLTPGTHYYYRVFVVDDGPSPESSGSNVVDVVTPG